MQQIVEFYLNKDDMFLTYINSNAQRLISY